MKVHLTKTTMTNTTKNIFQFTVIAKFLRACGNKTASIAHGLDEVKAKIDEFCRPIF